MNKCILGNIEGFFNPCRICKHRDIIGVTACYCTKNFFQVEIENLKNKFKKNKIVNVVGTCTYDDKDEYKKAHRYMEEEIVKDYAERHRCSVVSVFENGEFTRNIVVKN